MLGNPAFIYVDSDYAISGTAENFIYKLDLPKSAEYDHVALIQANIPKSYYLVKDQHNTITLTEDGMDATITIPIGNYSITSFRTVLQTELNSNSPNGYTYAITQPNITTEASTGKYTFTVSNNGIIQPILTFPSSSELYNQCGFTYMSSNTFTANTLNSTNVVHFNVVSGLLIKCDIVSSLGSDTLHGNSILQEIFQFNTFDFSDIGFQNNNVINTAKRLITTHPATANFKITDLNDNLLNFNGGSVNFSLVFFKKDVYHEAALRNIKMKWYEDIYNNSN